MIMKKKPTERSVYKKLAAWLAAKKMYTDYLCESQSGPLEPEHFAELWTSREIEEVDDEFKTAISKIFFFMLLNRNKDSK